ncbi:MAG: type I 3-dehydroquinate dehydratase [Phycisphaerales bacterium]
MSTLICVPIMVENPHEALDDAMLARAKSAELVEYRVDSLFKGDEESTHAVEELVAESPLPCIITCRPKWEGGNGGGYEGTEEARLALFEHLVSLDQPPRYIDIELSAIERTPGFIDRVIAARTNRQGGQNSGPTLLISVHDFAQRPADLYKMMSKMRRFDACRVHKYAWRARSIRDNLELFELLRERDRPTIALGMGEFGLMSRVLAPKFGGFLTFASLRDDSATAPGQPTLEELLNLYRFRSINAKNRVYGVIGWPVAQSRSPHIHNASFEAIEHNGVYLPLPVIEGWESFKATLGALLDDQHLDFAGCSVTIPHKEHLLRRAGDQSRD